jgi:hypothetical protein
MHRWSLAMKIEGGRGRWLSKETRIHLTVVEGGQQQQAAVGQL